MNKYTYLIEDIHPTDCYYAERHKFIGKKCNVEGILRPQNVNPEKYAGYKFAEFVEIEGFKGSFIFLAIKLKEIGGNGDTSNN